MSSRNIQRSVSQSTTTVTAFVRRVGATRWSCNLPFQNTLQHGATHYTMLQHTGTLCNTLQHTPVTYVCPIANISSRATHCNTLQHTATHCNTLQHTATHTCVSHRPALCVRTLWLTLKGKPGIPEYQRAKTNQHAHHSPSGHGLNKNWALTKGGFLPPLARRREGKNTHTRTHAHTHTHTHAHTHTYTLTYNQWKKINAVVCCSVLQCVAACCRVLQCVTACCNVLQCVAVCCSVLQCAAVCCSVL